MSYIEYQSFCFCWFIPFFDRLLNWNHYWADIYAQSVYVRHFSAPPYNCELRRCSPVCCPPVNIRTRPRSTTIGSPTTGCTASDWRSTAPASSRNSSTDACWTSSARRTSTSISAFIASSTRRASSTASSYFAWSTSTDRSATFVGVSAAHAKRFLESTLLACIPLSDPFHWIQAVDDAVGMGGGLFNSLIYSSTRSELIL